VNLSAQALPRRKAQTGITLVEMLIVMLLISLLAGLSFPAVSAGIDSIRLRSSCDEVASLLNVALTKADRRQTPVEIIFSRPRNRIIARTLTPGFEKEVTLESNVHISNVLPAPPGEVFSERTLLIYPSGTFPRIAVELENQRGAKRIVRIDPLTGTPMIEAATQ
jgi:prepilin-type N-terminal cleavage/methylation domain-containing protein